MRVYADFRYVHNEVFYNERAGMWWVLQAEKKLNASSRRHAAQLSGTTSTSERNVTSKTTTILVQRHYLVVVMIDLTRTSRANFSKTTEKTAFLTIQAACRWVWSPIRRNNGENTFFFLNIHNMAAVFEGTLAMVSTNCLTQFWFLFFDTRRCRLAAVESQSVRSTSSCIKTVLV